MDCWILRILVQCQTVCVTWAFVPWAEDHIHAGKSDVVEGLVIEAFAVGAFVVEGFRNYTVSSTHLNCLSMCQAHGNNKRDTVGNLETCTDSARRTSKSLI